MALNQCLKQSQSFEICDIFIPNFKHYSSVIYYTQNNKNFTINAQFIYLQHSLIPDHPILVKPTYPVDRTLVKLEFISHTHPN